MISDQCSPHVENSHDCTGTGVLAGQVVYCSCACHQVRTGMILGALASLFTGTGWTRW